MSDEQTADPMTRIADALERIAAVLEDVSDIGEINIRIGDLSDCIIEGGPKLDENAIRIFDVRKGE